MHLHLKFSPSEETKIIISVSKKVSKLAVTRNTVKRRVRAVLRGLSKDLKKGTYLIVAKPGVEKIKGEALRAELVGLIKRG